MEAYATYICLNILVVKYACASLTGVNVVAKQDLSLLVALSLPYVEISVNLEFFAYTYAAAEMEITQELLCPYWLHIQTDRSKKRADDS